MPSASDNTAKFIASSLRLAAQDLLDAKTLNGTGSRSDTYHLQQGVEKILRALLTSEQVHLERKDAHQLGAGIDLLLEDHPLKLDLLATGFLTEYATTYRYPSPSGRIKANLPAERFAPTLELANSILERAAKHFGVQNLDIDCEEPAGTVAPMRMPHSRPTDTSDNDGEDGGGGGTAVAYVAETPSVLAISLL